MQELPGGGSHLRLRLSGLEEIERWILSWGTHANVLRPAALIARLHQTTDTLAHRYEPSDVQPSATVGLPLPWWQPLVFSYLVTTGWLRSSRRRERPV